MKRSTVREHPPSTSHPPAPPERGYLSGLLLRDAGERGLGVFAARSFARGEPVLDFGGPLQHVSEIGDFTHTIQVGPETFLGPSGQADDYVNHSCSPNCGLRPTPGGLGLVALRAIRRGDEITFDYSTCIQIEPSSLRCTCGGPSCRGEIGDFWTLPPATRRRYVRLGIVPAFILEREAAHLAGARRA